MRVDAKRRFFVVSIMCIMTFIFGIFYASHNTKAQETISDGAIKVVYEEAGEDTEEDSAEFDLISQEGAAAYIDKYADNLEKDTGFKEHIETAISTVREEIPAYATFWAMVPPLVAIILALITKEVYSSLAIGIISGGILYSNGSFEKGINHVISDGFIGKLSDSYNIGIILFLVFLGSLVAMMNKAGGSAAFGRWAAKHIKTRVGAQISTIILGVLIFVDDYFNCLTVGSVMRPVTDSHNVSRAKLAYLIDATAAPVCIIAPVSSWAAAVAGFASSAGAENGLSLFIQAIPYNFYALLTIVMMLFLAFTGFDYGSMKKHEDKAKAGDIFNGEIIEATDKMTVNPKGRVVDLVLPVIILILSCITGMIYSGGFFEGEDFVSAFANSDASIGLSYGSFVAIILIVIYFVLRRVLTFTEVMECFPEGFKAMVPAIMILTCAWTLKEMTDSIGAKIYISQLVENSASSFQMFLPTIIFIIAIGLSFATGTSWGTFGILIPIVLSVFKAGDPLMIVSISACMAGAVCGDHCSPISDTTIMASAGAQCNHINHVSTQLPYAMTVALVSAILYIISGFVPRWYIVLPIGIVLMLLCLFCIKKIFSSKKEN